MNNENSANVLGDIISVLEKHGGKVKTAKVTGDQSYKMCSYKIDLQFEFNQEQQTPIVEVNFK